MAKEISNGIHTVKLYDYKDRGRRMHQLAYYEAGRRKLRNFSDKSEAETIAHQVLGQLTNGGVLTKKTQNLRAYLFAWMIVFDLFVNAVRFLRLTLCFHSQFV